MWRIEILWDGRWIILETGIKSKDDANWKISKWRQSWDCRKEGGFRVKEVSE